LESGEWKLSLERSGILQARQDFEEEAKGLRPAVEKRRRGVWNCLLQSCRFRDDLDQSRRGGLEGSAWGGVKCPGEWGNSAGESLLNGALDRGTSQFMPAGVCLKGKPEMPLSVDKGNDCSGCE